MGALMPMLLGLLGRAGASSAGAIASTAGRSGAKGFSGAAAQAWFAGGGNKHGGDQEEESAVSGEKLLELLKSMGILTLGFGTLWKSMQMFIGVLSDLKDWSRTIFESQRELAQFNGSVAATFANFDANRQRITMAVAARNAPGIQSLGSAQADMERALAPLTVQLGDIYNAGATMASQIVTVYAQILNMSQLMEPMAAAARWYMRSDKKAEGAQPVVDYIKMLSAGKAFDPAGGPAKKPGLNIQPGGNKGVQKAQQAAFDAIDADINKPLIQLPPINPRMFRGGI